MGGPSGSYWLGPLILCGFEVTSSPKDLKEFLAPVSALSFRVIRVL